MYFTTKIDSIVFSPIILYFILQIVPVPLYGLHQLLRTFQLFLRNRERATEREGEREEKGERERESEYEREVDKEVERNKFSERMSERKREKDVVRE